MVTYKIKKGHKRSDCWPKILYFGNTDYATQGQMITFDESCKYEPFDDTVNRLFGVRSGIRNENDSVFFGWTYIPHINVIEIWAGHSFEGLTSHIRLCSVELDSTHLFQLRLSRDSARLPGGTLYGVEFIIDNEVASRTSFLLKSNFVTTLTPNFMGSLGAPHDMLIKGTQIENKQAK